jgi:hypothetical protein
MWAYNQTPSSELYHSGILGMKWGVRRYQNKDGTLTKAGKKRAQMTSKRLSLELMTDKDLKDRVDRMMLERNYTKLTSKDKARGLDYIRDVLNVAGSAVGLSSSASNLGSGKLSPGLDKVGESIKSTSKIAEEARRLSRLAKRKTSSSAGSMSSQELRDKVNRLSLEKNFRELTGEFSGRGARFRSALDIAGTGLALASSSLAIALAIKKAKSGG